MTRNKEFLLQLPLHFFDVLHNETNFAGLHLKCIILNELFSLGKFSVSHSREKKF